MNLTALFFIVLFVTVQSTEKPDHWVILVAGSKGFWNYRHQADICHAYQIMKDNGVPEDQIIVFSFDDVAHDSQNPFPGKLFNKKDGHDVYDGCKIDYRGEDVTPTKFLSILRGEGDGKTLKSDENSKVFINFADHGAPGLIAFPNDELYARDFHKTLHEMHSAKKYGEMTIYIEACESGSMFQDILEDNINVYATTAADPHESSWAYYCAPDDTVDGVSIGS
jgi:legumain